MSAPDACKTTTIYVVRGTTGEHSDRVEWLVKAYRSEKAAKAEVARLSAAAFGYEDRLNMADPNYSRRHNLSWVAEFHRRIGLDDPQFRHDYTGTEYQCVAVAMEDK
jgi:hypothetical protein